MSRWHKLSFSILVFIANLVFLWYVIRKIILKLSTNRRDTLYKCSLLSPSLSVSLLKYWIMTCFHLFSEYQTTNFSHKYHVIFVLIFFKCSKLRNKNPFWNNKISFSTEKYWWKKFIDSYTKNSWKHVVSSIKILNYLTHYFPVLDLHPIGIAWEMWGHLQGWRTLVQTIIKADHQEPHENCCICPDEILFGPNLRVWTVEA